MPASASVAAVTRPTTRLSGRGAAAAVSDSMIMVWIVAIDRMVKQNYDVSCGAAALATILNYYYGREISEQAVMESIFETASEDDQANIAKYGFSMLELKRAGEHFGFLSAGFKIEEVEKLIELEVPAITLINTRGYNHFVVVKGISRGRVEIADPAFGNRTRTLRRFGGEWNNVVLVFVDPENPGKSEFSAWGTPHGRVQDVIPWMNQGLRPIIARPANEF